MSENQNRLGFFRRFLQSPLAGFLPLTSSLGHDRETEALLRHLMREERKKEAWEMPLEHVRFVVVDCETTGFNVQTDCLLSLGAVEMHGGNIVPGSLFDTLIRPEPFQHIPPLITELTGIRDEAVAQAPLLDTVLPPFLQFAKEAVLVMHHAAHDVRFLNRALTKKYHIHLHHRVVDTCDVAKWLFPQATSYTLDHWLLHYDIPLEGRHTAIGDAKMTARLWGHLLDEAVRRGVNTLGELQEAVVLAKRGSRTM
jgi:DNA polymerase III subunit epsilon